MPLPFVAHIPHSSAFIPPDRKTSFTIGDHDLALELRRLTDWHTDDLFSCTQEMGGTAVVYPVSRLVLDPERFEDDDREIMAARGMGVIYIRTSDGRALRARPSEKERQELLDRFYRPHHRTVERAVEKCLGSFDTCLIIDCHSFCSRPLPFELDQDPVRPDICLGTDPFHTPPTLTDSIEKFFHTLGWAVYHDKPYRGTYVPLTFYGKDKRVASIMIELNRKLYMDEETGEKLLSFPAIQRIVARLLSQLIRLPSSS